MKTRIVVHIGFNSKGERAGIRVEHCGKAYAFITYGNNNKLSSLFEDNFNNYFPDSRTFSEWKIEAQLKYQAVRFQRIILDGEYLL